MIKKKIIYYLYNDEIIRKISSHLIAYKGLENIAIEFILNIDVCFTFCSLITTYHRSPHAKLSL